MGLEKTRIFHDSWLKVMKFVAKDYRHQPTTLGLPPKNRIKIEPLLGGSSHGS